MAGYLHLMLSDMFQNNFKWKWFIYICLLYFIFILYYIINILCYVILYCYIILYYIILYYIIYLLFCCLSLLFDMFRNSDTIKVSLMQRMILSEHNIFLFILATKCYRNQWNCFGLQEDLWNDRNTFLGFELIGLSEITSLFYQRIFGTKQHFFGRINRGVSDSSVD